LSKSDFGGLLKKGTTNANFTNGRREITMNYPLIRSNIIFRERGRPRPRLSRVSFNKSLGGDVSPRRNQQHHYRYHWLLRREDTSPPIATPQSPLE